MSEKINELNTLKQKYGFVEPNRGNLDDATIEWLEGKPNYTNANLEYFKGKYMNHAQGSLEQVVEDLVKTWEMEASHKKNFNQWTTVDHSTYHVAANGGKIFQGEDAKSAGNYKWLMYDCKKELFNAEDETFESSHKLFRGCFKDGFPWEIISVFSGPPKVVFSWRHWGKFNGEYKGREGDGEVYNMFGIGEATVTENLKLQSIYIYYKPDEFCEALEGKKSHRVLEGGKALVGSGCPYAH